MPESLRKALRTTNPIEQELPHYSRSLGSVAVKSAASPTAIPEPFVHQNRTTERERKHKQQFTPVQRPGFVLFMISWTYTTAVSEHYRSRTTQQMLRQAIIGSLAHS